MTDPILSRIHFRTVSPTDVPTCYEIEKSSYPADEAASKSALQYRQHHAAPYFRCAVLGDEDEETTIVGYICSTRCRDFVHESMSIHDPSGPVLAVHSVVVAEQYRGKGIATAMMKDYISAIKSMNDGVEKLVLLSKSNMLGFYVRSGFSVLRPSDIVHGQETWYDCELNMRLDKNRLQGYPCWVVDSFAEEGGSGNPAAVVLLPADTDITNEETTGWMQLVAKEFNLSETAFIWPVTQKPKAEKEEDGDDDDETADGKEPMDEEEEPEECSSGQVVNYFIRYFTCNGTEVDLCGHATLASGAILFQTLPFKLQNDAAINFEAKKHLLRVSPHAEGTKTWMRNGPSMRIKMDLPKKSLVEITTSADRSAVLSMLKSAFQMPDTAENILYLGVDEDGGDILIELTREYFLNLGYTDIGYSALMEWDGYSRGLILCCRELVPTPMEKEEDEDEEVVNEVEVVDFLSRFFAPKAGINEDPVTGSAHCTLAPYFGAKLNKSTLLGKQTSQRGGLVTCVVEEDLVSIIGTTVTTMNGSLCM